jgi:hypothetical protein
MRVTCERCLRRYDVPDATVKGRKIRARCKCGARVVVQDEERAARSSAGGGQTTGSIQRPVRWFVDITSWEPIAMDLRQLVRAFDGGRIDADTLVWRKGMPDWRRLRDVTELAERLMGTDANGKTPPMQESAMGPANAASEPPPRQPERSRTPPASYSVGESEANGEGLSGEAVSSSAAAATSTRPGGAGAGAHKRSLTPLEAQERSERNSLTPATLAAVAADGAKAFNSSSSGATPGGGGSFGGGHATTGQGTTGQGLSVHGDVRSIAPRTITQTGLAAPPLELAERASTAPMADTTSLDAKSSDAQFPDARPLGGADAEGAANNQSAANQSSGSIAAATTSTAGATPRVREGRSSASLGAPRRKPSSDETPAQKPSSMSVPAGALAEKLQRPRFRNLVAISGLVLVVGLLLHGAFSADSALSSPMLPAAEQRAGSATPSTEPAHIERSQTALEPLADPIKPVPEIKAVAPIKAATPQTEASAARSTPLAKAEPAATTTRAVADPAPAALHGGTSLGAAKPSLPGAVPSGSTTASGIASGPSALHPAVSSPPVAESHPSAPAKPMGSATPERPLPNLNGRPAPAERAPTASAPPVSALPHGSAPESPAAPQKPTAAAPDAARSPKLPAAPSAPGPFDRKLAQQQLDIAAFKASTCGQLGQTRGAGEVSVTLESWGRVVHVTHLNPGFVGTPVGLCVTQAFQQLQVPPFSGGPQSLTGSFVVQ